MTQQEIESQARELAERCAKEVLRPRYRYVGDDDESYREQVDPTISSIMAVILRELNLVALLEDKAILNEMQFNNEVHVIIHRAGIERMVKPYGTPNFPLRTAITNAMKETLAEKEREK